MKEEKDAFEILAREVRALTAEIHAGREIGAEALRQQRQEMAEVSIFQEEAKRQRQSHLDEIAKIKMAHEAEVKSLRQEIELLSSGNEAEVLLQRAVELGEKEGYFSNALTLRSDRKSKYDQKCFVASQHGSFGDAEGKGSTVIRAVTELLAAAKCEAKKRREEIEAQFPGE